MTQTPDGHTLGCGGLAGLLLAALAGTACAAIVSGGLRLLDASLPGATGRDRWLRVAAAVGAVGLWWWEAHLQAILPVGSPPPSCGIVGLRFTGHLILGCFLAAATAVDLRHRVIPDAITVPGVLAGLAWNTLFPQTLPPITRDVVRSFAPPAIEPDLLGGFGGLSAGLPAWLAESPAITGLVVATLVFLAWWWIGMPPGDAVPLADGSPRTRFHPRWLVATGGCVGIAAAWLFGGLHWAGLVTSLIGLAAAAGMIWATRAGASRALGREAMGFGDVTLMAMVGSWIGWQACVLVCGIAVFIGLVHGIGQLLRHAESELPFGPSLCLATATVLVGWKPLWALTGPQFARPLELAMVVALVIGLTAVTLWVWNRVRGSGAD